MTARRHTQPTDAAAQILSAGASPAMTQTPAGWYPAPDRPGQFRYWDGQQWMTAYAPMSGPDAAMPAPPAANAGSVSVPRWLWRYALPGVLIAVLVGVFNFRASQTLDEIGAESEIEAWWEGEVEAGSDVDVDCPGSMEIEAGKEYHCIVSAQGESSGYTVTLTVENSDGEVTYRVG